MAPVKPGSTLFGGRDASGDGQVRIKPEPMEDIRPGSFPRMELRSPPSSEAFDFAHDEGYSSLSSSGIGSQ
jgi:hypothetical protein